MIDQRRVALSKYYDKVKKCDICRTYYGVDLNRKEYATGTCPLCFFKMKNKQSIFSKEGLSYNTKYNAKKDKLFKV